MSDERSPLSIPDDARYVVLAKGDEVRHVWEGHLDFWLKKGYKVMDDDQEKQPTC